MSEERVIRREDLIRITDTLFEIPSAYRDDMRVPARIYTSEQMLEDSMEDLSLWQLINIATLPGIQKAAYAMPDIHQGYGFPIGGVAATALDHGGVISPGGIGYDINCGVRLLAANISATELRPYLEDLATELFYAIPSGVGRGGRVKLTIPELNKILRDGARHMITLGYGIHEDIEVCEEYGCMDDARPELVSDEAKKRGHDQLGTLGSGNHFLEIQAVDEIYDEQIAATFGLSLDQVTVMIHCGSRGLGHQTCTDYVRTMMNAASKWKYHLPDRELVCAPFLSQEGQDYFAAMAAAANFAWANRHLIGHWVRQAWQQVVGNGIAVKSIYDISHNIGKRETHLIDGREVDVVMHRKGATRAFGPGRPEIASLYRYVGQPVLIPGTMGTASYILSGTQESMDLAFGSSCHGAGRQLSRHKAKKTIRGSQLRSELESHGIVVRCDSDVGLAEEAPIAYKDVNSIVQVVHNAGLAKKVARVRPLAVIKGG